ncbi:hypothetical protein BEWA_002460 [Theileria equi strain WA]|uniref:tRNA pseudouridine(55) synthase n=1 Tax=Theileria equi strain WA TaxID=1537102 RepID=L0B130_THEEQ|nr:hypothetical protein BEWA_002460 [Theileria equi strain WA]AFZ80839.1 hypothetical protein BEWA_002460 [Theileria equi strain WA]|eukprot:XP_004830505.1 hypothetical protein BEWA_002460 [Theileria equi strain WA]
MDEKFRSLLPRTCLKCFRTFVAPQYRDKIDHLHTKLVFRGDFAQKDGTFIKEGESDDHKDICSICRCCTLDGYCRLFDNVKFHDCLRNDDNPLETVSLETEQDLSDEGNFSLYKLFDAINMSLRFETCDGSSISKGFNFCVLAIHLVNNVAINERFKRTFMKNLLQVSLEGIAELPKEWSIYLSKLGYDDLLTLCKEFDCDYSDIVPYVDTNDGDSANETNSGSKADQDADHTEAPQVISQVVDYRLRQEILDTLVNVALKFKREASSLYNHMENACKDKLLFEQLIRMKVNATIKGSEILKIVNFSLSRDTITFTGVYNKNVRGLSQTLWILDNKVVTPISIEECIGAPLNHICGSREYKFMASGREDSDVRTFGNGRIFCIEMYNCTRDIFEILYRTSRMDEVFFSDNMVNTDVLTGMNDSQEPSLLFLSSLGDCKNVQHADARLLKEYFGQLPATTQAEFSIQTSQTPTSVFPKCQTPSTEFRNLRISFNSRFERQRVQNDAEGKLKSYNCLVFSADPLDINVLKRGVKCPIDIKQRNPVRISHRRSQDIRNRTIYSLEIDPIHPRLFLLSISTQAGTYVKEFVTGDLGRTRPSLKSILGSSELYVLHLDVLDIQS